MVSKKNDNDKKGSVGKPKAKENTEKPEQNLSEQNLSTSPAMQTKEKGDASLSNPDAGDVKKTPEPSKAPEVSAQKPGPTPEHVGHSESKATPGIVGMVGSDLKSLKAPEWNYDQIHSDDPLLSCLETIAGILGNPTSSTALKAGLPLEKGYLTPSLFVRAADRIGLSARLIHKKLEQITPYTLPCVLLLEGDKACLLVGIDYENQSYEVVFPETGRGLVQLAKEDLKNFYSGNAFFVKKQYRYDQRSADLVVDKPRSWFWGTLKKSSAIYFQVALAAIFINLFAIASPLFTMNVYDRVVPNSAIETLWVLSIGILLVFIFEFILKMLRVYFVDTAGKKADILLASRLFETIMTMRLASRPKSSGAFANEVREFESLREFFSSATLVAFIDLPFVLMFLLTIYLLGGLLAIVPIVAIPIIIGGAYLFHAPLTDWVRRTFREGAQKHALLVEAINGLETIKSFAAEGRMQKNWERFVSQSADSSKALKFFAALAMNYSGLIQQSAYICVIILGVHLIAAGDITMGALIACSILTSRALAPLAQMVSLMTKFNQSMTALKVLDEIMKLPSERPKGKNFINRPLLKGKVEFKNVSFSYPDRDDKALIDINLKINAGDRIAFLGRIGSGKSTIERLALGLYEPTEGSVLYDNLDMRQIDPSDLRENIGYVPQDIYLFFGTLRENITFGSLDIDEERFLRAAEISGVMDFVSRHPAGFDMPISEGGSNLSGGQRQAIAVARALVRNPSIFLMDEPTSMMDHASEAGLTTRLGRFLQNKTFILITHRVPLLKIVNRLVVMDGGRIVADGPKDQIMTMLSKSQIRTAR